MTIHATRAKVGVVLGDSERRFRALIENSADAITLIAPDGTVVYDSPAAPGLLGYDPDELVGRNAFELMHPHDVGPTRALFQYLLGQPNQRVNSQFRLRHKDGAWRWIDAVASNLLAEPSVQAIVINYRDVTERKQAETALAQTNDLLSRAEQIGHLGSWAWDVATDRVVWSDGLYRIFGQTRGNYEPTLASYLELVHPDDRERVRRSIAAADLDHQPVEMEVRIVRPDGQVRVIYSRAESFLDADGQIVRQVGMEMDITERKQAEEAVAVSEADLRSLFSAMTDVVMVLDSDGRHLKIAPTNPGLLVRPAAELLGRTVHEVMPRAEADTILAKIQQALRDGQPVRTEYSLEFGGRRIWFDGTVSPMGPNRVFWIARDVTERMQRERELQAVAAVSAALRVAHTHAQMLPIVLEQVMSLLDAGSAALAMRDPATNELVIAAGQGEMSGIAGQRLPAGAGIGGEVLATGRPYVTTDAPADTHFYQMNWVSHTRAVACVPLITHTQVSGVLWAGRSAGFTDLEVRLLTAIADITANALQRTALYEQTEQRLQRLAALREIDNTIMNSMDLRTTLMILVGHVMGQLGVDACDILLLTRGVNVLEYSVGRGFRSKAIEQTRLRLGEGHAGRAALERRLIAVPDLVAEPIRYVRDGGLIREDFAALFCVPLVAKGQVVGVLEAFHRTRLEPDSDWLAFLETLGGLAAIAVADSRQFNDLQRSNMDMLLAYDTTLEGWSAALDLRDKETEGHSQRVTELTLQLARSLGVTDSELEPMRRGALLHDIGKMGVPDSILLKPGPLTDEEWVTMRQHPTHAFELLSPIAFLRPALDIPYCHHEKWDGTGYPRGLKGESIPFAARIFAVVDVWDALSSDRPYRLGWPEAKVREYIRGQSGKHFDPIVVDAILALRA